MELLFPYNDLIPFCSALLACKIPLKTTVKNNATIVHIQDIFKYEGGESSS